LRFWCSTLEDPWSWTFRAYPGVWLATLLLVVPYLICQLRTQGQGLEHKKKLIQFLLGSLAFWVASDWPLGLLGASYLAFAHMIQFMLYTLIAAPLILLGTPEWMARRLLRRIRLHGLSCTLSKPVIAGSVFNLTLVLTHSPWAVDTLRSSQFGSFAMDFLWLLCGLLVWLPIISPLPEHRMSSYPGKIVYLFLAMGVVPAIPAGFMTFASFPLYATYELAPRVHNIGAITDQQMAGLIMKLGGIPIIWGSIVVIMMRWSEQNGKDEITTDSCDPQLRVESDQ
jgi:putative membrane protein